jgi:hypothetical protein
MKHRTGFTHLVVVILISVLAVGLVGVAWWYEESKEETIDISSWQLHSSKSGIKFQYPSDWEVADSSHGSYNIYLTVKGEKFYAPLRLDTYGRNEYQPLSMHGWDRTVESQQREHNDKTWTYLECGDYNIPKMLHPPYMDLYYIDLPDGVGTLEIASFMKGMVANDVISQERANEIEPVIEKIICSIGFLSESEIDALEQEQEIVSPIYYDPPPDLVNVEDTDGWPGVSSDILGFSLYGPSDWNLEFEKQAPTYYFMITPADSLSIANEIIIRFQINHRIDIHHTFSNSEELRAPSRTDTVIFNGENVALNIFDYETRVAEPGGSDIPQLSANFDYVNETHVVSGRLTAIDPSQELALNIFKEIVAKLNLRQYPEQEYEWKTFSNERLQFSVRYPEYMEVSQDGSDRVGFLGPITTDGTKNWPNFKVSLEVYITVPQDMTLQEYIAKRMEEHRLPIFFMRGARNLSTPEDIDEAYSEIEWVNEPEYKIAGQSVVHLRIPKSGDVSSIDYFYVINYNTLLEVAIINEGERQDWDLFNQFLDGITFDWQEG